ncbi:MAG: biopolymer transporter ExbD [Rubrivivax sp.]|nr:biopolymer transporter ExbD [Rubrivivax sp.]
MAARRRLRRTAAGLEVTAFINLIVVLVPFLLSTTVFTRMAVLDLSLPAQSSGVEQLKVDQLQLELVIRPERIDVADRIGGLIRSIPAVDGRHDYAQVTALMGELKQRFPQHSSATLLAEPQTPYEQVVQLMDAVRARVQAQGAQLIRTELFPDIAIGDAPLEKRT